MATCKYTKKNLSLQILMGIVQTATSTMDWPRVAVCEVALTIRPATVDRLAMARVAHPDATSGILDCPQLFGLPVRTSSVTKDDTPPATSKPRTCHQCGKPGWSKGHVCVDADILAFVKSRVRKN